MDTLVFERSIDSLQEMFGYLAEKIPERIEVIKRDVLAWEKYLMQLDQLGGWVDNKKMFMELEKPKERGEIEKQKQLLEVCFNRLCFKRIFSQDIRNIIRNC